MRYQVRHNGHTSVIEAREFFPQNTGIIFYQDRMRPQEGRPDQWGNPVVRLTRVAVAFLNNVESILEIPEEDPAIPVVATGGINVAPAPWGIGGGAIQGTTGDQVWFNEAPIEPVDGDGINWDEAQVER